MNKGRTHIFKDKAGAYRWHYKRRNGEIVAASAEGYKHLDDCLAIASELHPGVRIDIVRMAPPRPWLRATSEPRRAWP